MDKRPVGIFDSGLGGLTCLRKVMDILPNEDIIYFGDTARVPYGTRSKEQIIKYVRQDINFLKSFDIKYIIVACGTASSLALSLVKDDYDIKITGVLTPTCKKASAVTKNNRIGVIGTPGTIKSGKYKEELLLINKDLFVFEKACPLFVPLVENGHHSSFPAKLIAEEYLKEMKENDIDTLILGCTHYPLLNDLIKEILGDKVTLIDSGKETAIYAKEEMERLNLLSDKKSGTVKYFVSDITENFSHLGGLFLKKEIGEDVERINIEDF